MRAMRLKAYSYSIAAEFGTDSSITRDEKVKSIVKSVKSVVKS